MISIESFIKGGEARLLESKDPRGIVAKLGQLPPTIRTRHPFMAHVAPGMGWPGLGSSQVLFGWGGPHPITAKVNGQSQSH